MIQANLKIEGMSCSHCVASVERLIKEADGVESVSVSLPDSAQVTFDENRLDEDALKKIINDSELFKAV